MFCKALVCVCRATLFCCKARLCVKPLAWACSYFSCKAAESCLPGCVETTACEAVRLLKLVLCNDLTVSGVVNKQSAWIWIPGRFCAGSVFLAW